MLAIYACNKIITLNDIYEKYCCLSPDCLEKCYGIVPDLDNDLFIKAKSPQINKKNNIYIRKNLFPIQKAANLKEKRFVL